MDLLLIADSTASRRPFHSSDDAAGDAFGVDAYGASSSEDGRLTGYQYKFFGSPWTSQQRRAVEIALDRAVESCPAMDRWILVTPEDLLRSDREWLHALSREHNRPGVDVEHWGHHRILELAMRYPHIGRAYFPELSSRDDGSLVFASLRLDESSCDWTNRLDPVSTTLVGYSNTPAHRGYVLNGEALSFSKLPRTDRAMFAAAAERFREVHRIPGGQASALVKGRLALTDETFYKAVIHLRGLGGRSHPRDRGAPGRTPGLPKQVERWIADVASGLHALAAGVGEDYEAPPPPTPELSRFRRGFLRTPEPVFDVTVLNTTRNTVVISGGALRFHRIWSEIKAGPRAEALLPVGEYVVTADFTRRVSYFPLDPPIAVGSERAARFSIRVQNWDECPGNCARLDLEVRHAAGSAISDVVKLSF